MRYKGRYVPDKEKYEFIDRGNGVTEIVRIGESIENTEPIEPIKHFYWTFDKPKQPKKDKTWVVGTVIAAGFLGGASIGGLFYIPVIAGPVLIACLGWMAVVAFANR